MHSRIFQVVAILIPVLPFLLAACAKEPKTIMDTATFDGAFQAGPQNVQSLAGKVSTAFKQGAYIQGANTLEELIKIVGRDALTEEQKNSIYDLLGKAQAIMSEDAKKSDMKAFQAIENAIAAMEGRAPMPQGLTPIQPPLPTRE
jgi:hypothetical protein